MISFIDTKKKEFVSFNSINFLNYYMLLLVQEQLVMFEAFFLKLIFEVFSMFFFVLSFRWPKRIMSKKVKIF